MSLLKQQVSGSTAKGSKVKLVSQELCRTCRMYTYKPCLGYLKEFTGSTGYQLLSYKNSFKGLLK